MGAMRSCSSDSLASVEVTMEVTASFARCDRSSDARSFLTRDAISAADAADGVLARSRTTL